MKSMKKWLSLVLSLCMLASVLPLACFASAEAAPVATDEEFVVGRFMYEGAIADKDLPGKGNLGVSLEAPVPINIAGYDKEDLAIRFSYRITRSDGLTGPGSLSRLRNGYVRMYDSAGAQRTNFGSPTQNGVPGELREAGKWLDVSYQLSAMSDGTDRLTKVDILDYNDFPNKKDDGSFEFSDGCDVGMYMEVRDVRIVDTSKDANGTPIPKYTLTTFKGFGGDYEHNGRGQWYADWKYADIHPVDLSENRSDYRLQMKVKFTSTDDTVDLDTCFGELVVKLRSIDQVGKENDPNGASNHEHNIAWKFTPSTLKMTDGEATLSIDLGDASIVGDSRGLIDWAKVERIITYASVASSATDKADAITMTLSDVQIVDIKAVESIRENLTALLAIEQDETLFSEADKAVYDAALAEAERVVADEMASVSDLQEATANLKAAQLAGDAGKATLLALLAEEIDPAEWTAASMERYNAAKQVAQLVADAAGATNGAVDHAVTQMKEAKSAMEPQRGVNYGDVDKNGKVDVSDALAVLQHVTGKVLLTGNNLVAANVDGNDKVDVTDALTILQYVTGKITVFPAEASDDLTNLTEVVINEDPLTFCNPINLNYKYQDNYNGSREAADPAVVVFKGEYWLFASHNEGYWHSDDLCDWEFVQVDVKKEVQNEFRKFAPATMVIGDYLYLTHSEQGAFIRTTDPSDPEKWEFVSRPSDDPKISQWGDPAMLYDDPATGGDGYVYAVEGTSPDRPIIIMKFDPNNNMKLVEGPVEVLNKDLANHGWENSGDSNTNYNGRPFLEGAWINKYEGKYYVTYALPGTADASYADGCYVADEPMGPYTYCENSPVIRKASGFVRGAGHGCLFEDMKGNWWKVDTVALSVNTGFERRLAIFPAMFDEEGDLYSNTVLGDYPTYRPHKSEDPFFATNPGWTLLSYGKDITVSSTLNRGKSAAKAADENMRTWWSAETGNVGEYLMMDLGKLYGVWSMQVNFADQDTADNANGRVGDFSYKYLLEFSQDGEEWYTIADCSQSTSETSHDYYEFAKKLGVRYIRVTNKGAVPQGGKFAISDLRVFGDPVGIQPEEVTDFTVERYVEDERSVGISWDAVDGAQGYIVRFGVEEDQLFNHHQVIAGNAITLHCLNMGVDYYFAVDSYGEGGYTVGTQVIKAPWTVEPIQPTDPEPDPDPDPDPEPEPDPDPNPTNGKIDGFAVYEAENAAYGNEPAISGTKVNIQDAGTASGGKVVGNTHTEGGFIEFTNVDGGEGGTATLRITFANGNSGGSMLRLFVNGKDYNNVVFNVTSSWSTFETISITLDNVTAGETNTIRLEQAGGGVNVDYIQLVTGQ